MSDLAGITRMGDRQRLAVFGSDMAKTRQPQDTSARLAARVLVLANAAIRTFDALAADRALAQLATTKAALPRQRLAELRALYTTHDPMLVSARVDKAARSTAFESFEFLSAYEEKRAA
jgi:hypothetical protein